MSAEDELRALLESPSTIMALEAIYERQLARILRELALGISQPGAARATELIARIRALVNELDPSRAGMVRRWIQEAIPQAYVLGDDAATRQLKGELGRLSAEDQALIGPVQDSFTAVNQAAMRAIVALASDALQGAAQDVLSGAVQAIQRTQLTLHVDAAIREATAGGILTGRTGAQVSNDIANIILKGGSPDAIERLRAQGFRPDLLELYRRLEAGQLVKVGGRNFDVRSYANLVARTMMAEATSKAAIVRLQQNGVDHIQISEHVQKEPDICTIFAGRVFYIGSGRDPLGFPNYRDYPQVPYHPHCAHAVLGFVAGLKSNADLGQALFDAELLPDEYSGKSAREVERLVEELTPAQLEAIQPRSRTLLPKEFFQHSPEPPPAKAAA